MLRVRGCCVCCIAAAVADDGADHHDLLHDLAPADRRRPRDHCRADRHARRIADISGAGVHRLGAGARADAVAVVRQPAADHPLAPPATTAREGASAEWVQSLPIGNGRLGAMVFGGVVHERLQLNEDTIWAGGPNDPVNPDARGALPDARRLIAEGRYTEAAELTGQKIMARPLKQMPYQTLGDLALTFPDAAEIADYRRDLNLDDGHRACVRTRRTACASAVSSLPASPDQVIVVRLTADRPGRIDVHVGLQTPLPATVAADGDTLVLRGRNGDSDATTADGTPIRGALDVQARVRVLTEGGTVSLMATSLTVAMEPTPPRSLSAPRRATSTTATSAAIPTPARARHCRGGAKAFDALRAGARRRLPALFRRVTLDLGRPLPPTSPPTSASARTPDGSDPELAALYFQFGRYLLISSSRPGSQPANLQGIWNDSAEPAWGRKYTININTEMNYWPAETDQSRPSASSRCSAMVARSRGDRRAHGAGDVRRRRLGRAPQHRRCGARRRRSTARSGACGRPAAPGCARTCGTTTIHAATATFCERSIRRMKGAAEFFLDTLVEEPDASATWSPARRSRRRTSIRYGAASCAGPTMDSQILRDLFDAASQAAEILGVDADFRQRWPRTRARLPPMQIGTRGQLQEWLEDWDRGAGTDHRHVSHLYGLYPSNQITGTRHARRWPPPRGDRSRLRGDDGTGWATRLEDQLWARLEEGEHARTTSCCCWVPTRTLARTCSTRIRRSRSTATSAAPPASPRCCCRATTARSTCCRRCPRPGRPARCGPPRPGRIRRRPRVARRAPRHGPYPRPRRRAAPRSAWRSREDRGDAAGWRLHLQR